MKSLILTTIFSIACLTIFAQQNLLLNPKVEYSVDWKSIEVSFSKEDKVDFLNEKIDFEKIVDSNIEPYAKEIDNYHILDLNGDYKLDVLFYGVSNMRGLEKLTIYLNKEGILNSSFWDFGKIIGINKPSIHSPFQISLLLCQGSITEVCKLTNVTILNSPKDHSNKDCKVETTVF